MFFGLLQNKLDKLAAKIVEIEDYVKETAESDLICFQSKVIAQDFISRMRYTVQEHKGKATAMLELASTKIDTQI